MKDCSNALYQHIAFLTSKPFIDILYQNPASQPLIKALYQNPLTKLLMQALYQSHSLRSFTNTFYQSPFVKILYQCHMSWQNRCSKDMGIWYVYVVEQWFPICPGQTYVF